MALGTDLLGLGMDPRLAERIAEGGTGPLTITAAGTAFSSATRIRALQTVVACSTAGGSGGAAISLPVPSELCDQFVIGNTTSTQSLTVFASSGVVITVGGTQDSQCTVPVFTTMVLSPISTTSWIGVKGS